MIFAAAKKMPRRALASLVFLCLTATLGAAPTGPTLQLDYGHGQPQKNLVSKFMYFVPLISPGPSTIFTNTSNTQCARVLSFCSQTNGATFLATCEFEFTGDGSLQNIFDPTQHLHRHEKDLQAGIILKHQLGAINVVGDGDGSVEVEGTLTGGQPTVNKVSIRFAGHSRVSPVTVSLQDFAYRNGAIRTENEMVARVEALVFQRTAGPPKMEVVLASLKAKDAGDSLWQNFVGSLKGATANLFLPPLEIEAEGQATMFDFGRALALKKPAFTFPFATRLQGIMAAAP
jgi:hypothetical protein